MDTQASLGIASKRYKVRELTKIGLNTEITSTVLKESLYSAAGLPGKTNPIISRIVIID